MLRDRFVMGLNNEKIQQTLLAETDLTFDRAVSIETAREIASKDASHDEWLNELYTWVSVR